MKSCHCLGVVGSGSGVVGGLGSSVVGLVLGLSLVPDIGNVARVGISGSVAHNLGATVGKENTVLAGGGVLVAVLVLGKVDTRVVISHSVAVLVGSGCIILLLVVAVGRGGVVSGLGRVSGLVVGRGGMVSGLGRVSGLVVGRGSVVSRLGRVSGLVVGRGSVVGRGGMVGRGGLVCGGGMVSGGSMVGRGGMVGRGVDRAVGRGVSSSGVLILVVGLVDLVGLGRGLAHNLGVVRAMGAVHGGADSGGIALLDRLVARLVGGGNSHEGSNSDDGLKKEMHFYSHEQQHLSEANVLYYI